MKKVMVMMVIWVVLVMMVGVAGAQSIFVGKNEYGSKFYVISSTIEGNTGTVVDVLSYEELSALRASGASVRFISMLVLRVECLSESKARLVEVGYADGNGNVLYREEMNKLMEFAPNSQMRKACQLIRSKR
jgi:hypothetical protein